MARRWGRVDTRQLRAFATALEQVADDRAPQFIEAAAKELAARLLALVIPRTPVGRKPTLKQLGGEGTKKTLRVEGAGGKSRSFLTREGAILASHWGGYMGGTLRRGWTATTHHEAEQGGVPEAKAYVEALSIRKAGKLYEIEIINPVAYASYVEFGHRQTPGRYVPAIGKQLKAHWVDGKFMLTISENEIREILPSVLQKMLDQFLRECLDTHGR